MILIATALFAAVGVAMMEGSRGTTSMLTDEQEKVYANQIIAYGNEIKSVVKRLQLRGCTDTQISFENSVDTGYANTNNPPDKCKVFHPSGGGLIWMKPPEGALDSQWEVVTGITNTRFDLPAYSGNLEVVGLGTDCAAASCSDLVLLITNLSEDICEEINTRLGITGDLMVDGYTNYAPYAQDPQRFKGGYLYVNSGSRLGDTATNITGKYAGCFYNTGIKIPTFYQVLLAR